MKSSASGRNAGNVAYNEKMQRECYERFLVLFEERGYSDKFEFLGGRTSSKGKARIRCKLCGHEFERYGSFAETNSNLRCGYCWVHRDDEICAERDYKLAEHVAIEYEGGKTISEISAKYNIQEQVISKMLDDCGVNRVPNKQLYKVEKRRADKERKKTIQSEYVGISKDISEWRKAIGGLFDLSECFKALQKRRSKIERKLSTIEPVIATCKHCGKQWVFFPDMSKYGKKKPPMYCSRKCNNSENKSGNHSHRARKYGVPYESGVTLRKVYKRDGGVCYLCGERTDFNDAWIIGGCYICGDLYPTIDHVIPMSKGGGHTWANVRLACHKCNSIKSDKLLAADVAPQAG